MSELLTGSKEVKVTSRDILPYIVSLVHNLDYVLLIFDVPVFIVTWQCM